MDIQLQTILEPDNNICDLETLFYHRDGMEICYDGYFNLFYIEKWKRYTDLKKLQLVLTMKGFLKLRLYHNRDCVLEMPLDSDLMKEYRLEFPWNQYDDGVFWFSLTQNISCDSSNVRGFYIGICEKIRHVALAIDICTYKRETYVLRNLGVLCEKILKNEELQVSDALWVYVIDNGKTLDSYEPLRDVTGNKRISVIPNKNAGGAGGFTRGMLEALKRKEENDFTHIALMDDDAVMNPDLFVRMYGFLCALKEEWSDITVGGMMLDEANPYMLYVSGEEWNKGFIINRNKNIDLREYDSACRESLLTTRFEKERYSGWWCCCYSLNVVREDNLPIPLFLHHDDIEYGLRNRRYGLVFLNGICVWHRNFDDSPPESNLYYDIRNDLIEMTQQYNVKNALKYIWKFYWKRLAIRVLRNKQDEVNYVILGAKDFLRGPQWLWEQDPEQLHNAVKQQNHINTLRLWKESLKICCNILLHARKAVIDYQTNMKKYTTARAWTEYLGMESDKF